MKGVDDRDLDKAESETCGGLQESEIDTWESVIVVYHDEFGENIA
jgi:hypothetical protein